MNLFDYIAVLAVICILYLSRHTVWRIVIKLLGGIIHSYWYKLLIKPTALGLPSATLACYKIDQVKNAVPDIFKFIDNHIELVVVGLFIVPAITGLEDIIKSKSSKYSDSLPIEALFLLLTALESPVNQKMDRFLTELNSNPDNKAPGDIFNKITDPKKQIAEITRSIHIFFESWYKINNEEKIDFTTVVFRVENDVPVDVWSYFPQSQKPEPNLINDINSLAARSVQSKKMIVISDIEKEKKKKEKKKRISQYCLSDQGSAICYPLRTGHTKGDVPLTIRITTNKPFFDEENLPLYKYILEQFKSRLLIEYALSELKDRSIQL